jgi:HSP20 family protein
MNQMQDNKQQQEQGLAELKQEETHQTEIMESNTEQSQNRRPERTISPRASVHETADEVVLELEMPGVKRDSIQIKVENDELSICGERTATIDQGYEVLHQERLPFAYRRSFILSDRIATAEITATCQDGVLLLKLPKAAQAKPRRIEIQ